MDALARFGRLDVVSGDARAIAEAVAAGAIVVSSTFARRFHVSEGDSITLDTPKGPMSFRIAGLIHDFAGPAGSINIDLSIFDQLWLRRGARDLVLWTEGDPEPVIAEIRRRVGESQSLFFVYGDDLAHFASGFLRQFQGILMSVALLTAFLGGIAVWNLMLGAVTSRTRELALLLSVGATESQVRWPATRPARRRCRDCARIAGRLRDAHSLHRRSGRLAAAILGRATRHRASLGRDLGRVTHRKRLPGVARRPRADA
jgi:hypothetical protein